MDDPSAAADTNPFDQLEPDEKKQLAGLQPAPPAPEMPQPKAANENANPFDDADYKLAGGPSVLGAAGRAAAKSALPTIGSFPAIGAGAEVGAAFGPWGALAGGIVGGLGGGYLLNKAQDWALEKLPA